MRSHRRTNILLLILILVVTGVASSADARVFRMTGKWLQQRGAIAQIPIFGGIDNADGAMVSAMGSSPAALTIPVGAFTGMNNLLIPLPGTTLIQLSTQFSCNGPNTTANFVSGTKSSRPANFGFWPGAAANNACTTPQTGGNQGVRHGLVRYTAGSNQFGGTMQMLIVGTGGVSVAVGISPTRIQHQPLGGRATAPQEVGGSFANTATNLLPAGPITTGAVCATGPCVANAGLIVVPGVVTATGTPSTNFITGFPWTTGMVSAIVTTKLPETNSSLTGTGSDNRTALGLGNITLVAGGMAVRKPSNAAFPSLDTVTMQIKAQNLPSMSPMGLAALAALIALGAGHAASRRRNRSS